MQKIYCFCRDKYKWKYKFFKLDDMQKNMQALLRRQILHKKSCILQKTKFETKTIQQIETGTNYEKKSKRKFSIMSFMWRSNQVSIGAPKLLQTWPSSPSSWWWWWWSWWWRGLQQRARCMTAGPTPLGSIVCRIAAAAVVAKTSSLCHRHLYCFTIVLIF